MKKSILFILFFSSVVSASEGFFTDPKGLPPPVAKAWSSVFLLYGIEPQNPTEAMTGSAFLVNKISGENDHVTLVFLTSAHVFLDYKICTISGACPPLGLYRGFSIDPKTGLTPSDLHALSFKDIVVDEIGLNGDLAILTTEVEASVAKDLYPIPVAAEHCDALQEGYVIGYPATDMRPVPDTLKADYSVIKERWSTGRIYGKTFSRKGLDDKPMNMIVTTVDTVEGNSGSPLLNANGKVVGIVKNGPQSQKLADGTFVQYYVGKDDDKAPEFQTGATSCSYFSSFAR